MSQQKIIGANPYRNNGGTVIGGGNVGTNGPMTEGLKISELAAGKSDFNVAVTGENIGVKEINRAGTINGQGQFISPKVTSSLAGISNNSLIKPDNTELAQIHKIESISTQNVASGIRSGHYNAMSGILDVPVISYTTSFGQDRSARPSGFNLQSFIFLNGQHPTPSASIPRPLMVVSGVPGLIISNGDTTPTTTDTTHFLNVPTGSQGNAIFAIRNSGAGYLNVSSGIRITGTDSTQFIISGAPNKGVLNPFSDTVSFRIAFLPTSSGQKNAIVNIDNNDISINSVYSFSIRGTGA